MNDGLDHLSFCVFENSFFLAGIDERLNFLLRCLGFLFFRRIGLFFPAVKVVQHHGHQSCKGPHQENAQSEDRKHVKQDKLRIAGGDKARDQLPEQGDQNKHQNDRSRHACDVGNLSAIKGGKKKHGAGDQQRLNQKVNRH